MTEPQVWVLIGVFATAALGMMTIVSTLFVRVIRAEISGVRGEITGLRGEITGLRNEMNTRFTALDQRVDGLDRDVQALVKHTFGLDRG